MLTKLFSKPSTICGWALWLAIAGTNLFAQETPSSAAPPSVSAAQTAVSVTAVEPADGSSEAAAQMPPAPVRNVRGRLPRYFASVVDETQRLRIYAIQSSYRMKIEEIERQLSDLRAAEIQEIEAVLTPGQLERVEELRLQSSSVAASSSNITQPTPPQPGR